MIVYMNLFTNQNIPKSHCSTLAVTFALGFRFGPCGKDSLEPIFFLQSQRWHMFLQGFCSTILLCLIWENMCCQVGKTDCKAMKHEWYILVTPRRWKTSCTHGQAIRYSHKLLQHISSSSKVSDACHAFATNGTVASCHRSQGSGGAARARAVAQVCECVPRRMCMCTIGKKHILPVFSRSHDVSCICRGVVLLLPLLLLSLLFCPVATQWKTFGGFFQSKCVTHVGRSSQCYGPISCPG